MAVFVTPTSLRLTSGGVVNLDFLIVDNTARLTSGGIVGNGLALAPPPTGFQAAWAIHANQLIQ